MPAQTFSAIQQEKAPLKAKLNNLTTALTQNAHWKSFNQWLRVDVAAGFLAAGGISALYGFVQKIGNFLPPGIINYIFPVMILADTLGTIAAWKEFQLKRLAIGGTKGARNQLLRAILETVCAIGGAAVIVGAIVTTALSINAFAAYIAPAFMTLLGARTLFSLGSGIFHQIRAYRRDKQAIKVGVDTDEGKALRDQANGYRDISKIQLAAAGATAVGFVATTMVMLLHYFGYAWVGVLGGVALGGVMTYISTKVHQGRKDNQQEAFILVASKGRTEDALNTLRGKKRALKEACDQAATADEAREAKRSRANNKGDEFVEPGNAAMASLVRDGISGAGAPAETSPVAYRPASPSFSNSDSSSSG